MADRPPSQQSPSNPEEPLSDRLPLSANETPTPSPSAFHQAEAALTEKLAPAQLRAVASWMRAIALTYDHQAPPQVGHSFRAQASRLDQLARQLTTTETNAIVGTVMSQQVAYLMTAAGQYLRQDLSQPGAPEPPAEPCSEAEFRRAYHNPEFTLLLGAERLSQQFDSGNKRTMS